MFVSTMSSRYTRTPTFAAYPNPKLPRAPPHLYTTKTLAPNPNGKPPWIFVNRRLVARRWLNIASIIGRVTYADDSLPQRQFQLDLVSLLVSGRYALPSLVDLLVTT